MGAKSWDCGSGACFLDTPELCLYGHVPAKSYGQVIGGMKGGGLIPGLLGGSLGCEIGVGLVEEGETEEGGGGESLAAALQALQGTGVSSMSSNESRESLGEEGRESGVGALYKEGEEVVEGRPAENARCNVRLLFGGGSGILSKGDRQ